MAKTPGELRFENYLTQREFEFEYEAPIGGRKPDYLVTTSQGPVVCEVFEPKMPEVGGLESEQYYSPLRRGYKGRKAKQLHAAGQAGLPYMLVYAGPDSAVTIDAFLVEGAMFGNMAVSYPVDPDSHLGDLTNVDVIFTGGGAVQKNRKRDLSAAAVLETFNPTIWGWSEAYREAGLTQAPTTPTEWTKHRRLREQLDCDIQASGLYDPKRKEERLTVMHNPYAARPLGLDLFAGSFDLQRGLKGDQFAEIWRGPWYREVPARGEIFSMSIKFEDNPPSAVFRRQ